VPAGPIYKMNEVFADPQVQHLGMAVEVANKGGAAVTLVGPADRTVSDPPSSIVCWRGRRRQ